MLNDKLAYFVCPESHEPLTRKDGALVSPQGRIYRLLESGTKVDFLGVAPAGEPEFLNSFKSWLKHRLGRAYIALTWILSPLLPRLHWPTLQTWWRYQATELARGKPLVIQIGSGNDRISPDVINLDIFPFPEVDVLADCRRLPFADGTVDGVISLAVFEHVADPEGYLQEARRVLKPGGFVLTGAPFMQGFHASPDDYYRWTPSGLKALHARHGFAASWVTPMAGPTSGFLWVLHEWLSIVLSLGWTPLYYAWYFVLILVLFPIKILDLLLIHFPQAYKINSLYLYLGIRED